MITRRIRAYGIVQGVGFRPTVDRHATSAGIAGTVCNKGPYVEIYAQGSEGGLRASSSCCAASLPDARLFLSWT